MWFSRPKRRFGISAEEILKQERGIALSWPLDRDRLRAINELELCYLERTAEVQRARSAMRMATVRDEEERAAMEAAFRSEAWSEDEWPVFERAWVAARAYQPSKPQECGNRTHFGYCCMLSKGHSGDHRRWDTPDGYYIGWPRAQHDE